MYLTRFLQGILHMFDMQVSNLLVHATMLASYATHDFHVLIPIPTRKTDYPCTQICSLVVPRNSYLHVYHYYANEFTLAATLSSTLCQWQLPQAIATFLIM